MIRRSAPLKRTPLKRSSKPLRRTRLKPGKPKRTMKRLPPAEYSLLRAKVLLRDGVQCRAPEERQPPPAPRNGSVYMTCVAETTGPTRCSTTPNSSPFPLAPHHIIFRSQGGEDTLENLITLCAHHHRRIHDRNLFIVGDANTAVFTIVNPKAFMRD